MYLSITFYCFLLLLITNNIENLSHSHNLYIIKTKTEKFKGNKICFNTFFGCLITTYIEILILSHTHDLYKIVFSFIITAFVISKSYVVINSTIC